MLLTLNTGVSKKRSLSDDGSVGATCNAAVELDASLPSGDQDGFQRQVRNAYAVFTRSIHESLNLVKRMGICVERGCCAVSGVGAMSKR